MSKSGRQYIHVHVLAMHAMYGGMFAGSTSRLSWDVEPGDEAKCAGVYGSSVRLDLLVYTRVGAPALSAHMVACC